jgi:uncharacterized protein YndB with AHSA1/START domain/DNA-binding transcriptional ArsR family regulator
VDHAVLGALAEPNRLRIVELLSRSPRWVGEIASELGLRQPQVTKHLQTLQHAGLVTMHPLGQRRIYTLRREPLGELRNWLEVICTASPEEHVFERYVTAIASERALAARDPRWATGRRIRLQRRLPAPVSQVWAHWTTPALVRQWWSPEHFDVAECEIDPVPGGRLEITMRAPDGGLYPTSGRFLTVTPLRRLRFELSHLAASQTPVFTAIHDLRLSDLGHGTQLNLAIRITAASAAAPAAVAGIQPGWQQLLSKLTRTLRLPVRPSAIRPRSDRPISSALTEVAEARAVQIPSTSACRRRPLSCSSSIGPIRSVPKPTFTPAARASPTASWPAWRTSRFLCRDTAGMPICSPRRSIAS